MEDKIFDIITDLLRDDISKTDAVGKLVYLHKVGNKDRIDLLNWAKSQLAQEINPKLGKTHTPYRADKMKFLSRMIKKLNPNDGSNTKI